MHQKLNIPVAVKVLQPDLVDGINDRLLTTLRSEAQFLAQLNHPNVVRIYDLDDEGDIPFIVLEYVEGMSVADLISQSGRVVAGRAACIGRQAALGLAAGAKLGIIHRDVKPGNILLTRQGTVKIADLGLALLGDPSTPEEAGKASDERRKLVGTALYMSPEQTMCAPNLDHRSDIYSLGATLYHMLTGQPPFTGRSRAEIILKRANGEPISPDKLAPDLPAGLAKLVLTMLANKPEGRPQAYEEVIAGLQEYSEDQVVPAAKTSDPSATSTTGQKSGAKRSSWTFLNLFGRRTEKSS
jgi:serine/threonine protein kinase